MTEKNYYIGVSDISFYLTDDDGNIKTDKNGNEITYRLKDGIRYKPLEYITESIELNMLEKIWKLENTQIYKIILKLKK